PNPPHPPFLAPCPFCSPRRAAPLPPRRRSRGHRPPFAAPTTLGGPPPSTSSIQSIKSSGAVPCARHRAPIHRVHRWPPSSIASSPVHLQPPHRFRWNHHLETAADAPVIDYVDDEPSLPE
uniref:Uncharacterized protein n=1 Tax=Triticum urartu TaxID=4572 RepID=A0A8R7JX29_TRIUA